MKIIKFNWIIALVILSIMVVSGCSKDTDGISSGSNKNEKSVSAGVVEVSYDELMKLVKKEKPVFVMMAHNRDLQNTNAKQVLDYDAKQLDKKVYLFSWEDAPRDLDWDSNVASKTRNELESIGITEPKSTYLAFKKGKIVTGSSSIFSGKTRLYENGDFSYSIKMGLEK
ncbi:hypothetical protein [Bacillus thuringiensis]|uniref:Lipoprotein n=1 Tax=Bacillus thuringiensis serovar toumanoffi TaxID=180862 RepID=A0ABD5I9Q4_BACTU|nr:hypothetical protein [Bacillus thuringiensis]MDW9214039.1 hypothetical protein [Bacillus thuringiensis serovar toumanoffi]MCR6784390.1 hypothetical protein [Bacillus thuringiensis]MCR6869315.1 hypothetical protein [Bacillus thuringiensis]MED2574213.1 hypothetical protein [Bacillus thuringiensis]MED3218249.1 hypothetical protein [Bacillus thuringiensis]